MLTPSCITVPGLHGSGADHWQSWAEKDIPDCRRITGIDFEKPIVAAWAEVIRNEIRSSVGSVILIAHSFGCLASVVALADNDPKVAGVILVAPASPQRFSATGLITETEGGASSSSTLLSCVPAQPLGVPGLVVGSTDDPWLKLTHAQYWAETWGLRFILLRNAGHINAESGFGRWQALAQIVKSMREQASAIPLGDFQVQQGPVKTRFSALTRVRQLTREAME